MPELPPATASQRLITQAVPKRLAVRFRTRDHEDQGVVFTPVFTIDNLTVAPELVASAEEQTILGYRVTVSPTVRHIIETTRGRPLRLEKGKAAEYADLLFDRGIPVVSESGKLVGKGRAARVGLDLTLLPGDRLQVRSRLTLEDGAVLPKPKDIREVLDDAGWMPFGKEMVKLGLTATRLDNVLFEEGGDGILEGTLVPQVLKKLQGNGLLGAHARRDDTLRTLAVVFTRVALPAPRP